MPFWEKQGVQRGNVKTRQETAVGKKKKRPSITQRRKNKGFSEIGGGRGQAVECVTVEMPYKGGAGGSKKRRGVLRGGPRSERIGYPISKEKTRDHGTQNKGKGQVRDKNWH